MSIPDTTKRIREYQREAGDLIARMSFLEAEATEHQRKGQNDRASVLLSERADLKRKYRSVRASIQQLKAQELMTGVTPRRRKTDQVLR